MVILYVITGCLAVAGLYLYNQYKFMQAEKAYLPTGRYVTVEGIRLHYIDRGEGRPIIFLHGGVLTGNDFDQAMDLAVSQGYRVLSFDRPGYGHSERPRGVKVTPLTQAKLLHEAIKAIGIERPILVGHSWSGILVLSYALQYPDDLSGMVILGGGMYKEGYPAEKGDPLSRIVLTPFLGSFVLNTLLATLGPLMAKHILKLTFAPESVPADYQQATLALWLRPSQFKANRQDVMAFAPTAEQISKDYGTIMTPAVIVVGTSDPFPTKEHSYRLVNELPHAQLIELPDAAHMIPQNHPQAVVDAVEKLIREIDVNCIFCR
ncbi:alpha/beta fold hydrolase [Paenibacillus sp. J2TS4]|uniref:alpha/beta fold hydrolase n=1 Tax=Paenibacillus sp. J2TS4 TaxID=2807194 RepID=UPI001B2D7465|nr:alpha/beta hydrolase [Paenibacillus sp. J2TS4]GIP36699.1 alpha/beta hydrolase [Paenibacillus sp. J2TS4]